MQMPAPVPYDFLPPVASFEVQSMELVEGGRLATPQLSGVFGAGGADVSPALSWSGFPTETRSFVVTCFDPDAPTGSGFWHWTMYDIAANVTALATGAGAADGSGLPAGASQLRNDAGLYGYLGAAPPEGHGEHRYLFAVHALSLASLPISKDVTPAICGFNMFGSVLARAIVTACYGR